MSKYPPSQFAQTRAKGILVGEAFAGDEPRTYLASTPLQSYVPS